MTEEEKAEYASQVKREYEEEKTQVFAADYPAALTIRFRDPRLRELFASILCDCGGEEPIVDAVEEMFGLDASFHYHDINGVFLGDDQIRVFTTEIEKE